MTHTSIFTALDPRQQSRVDDLEDKGDELIQNLIDDTNALGNKFVELFNLTGNNHFKVHAEALRACVEFWGERVQ